MPTYSAFILGKEHYDKLALQGDQKTVMHKRYKYDLTPHKRLIRRSLFSINYVWIFRARCSVPLDVRALFKAQSYKKVSPSALKIVVSQNIEHTFFKSLLEKRGFGGFGRRRLIALFVAGGILVVALKAMGVY